MATFRRNHIQRGRGGTSLMRLFLLLLVLFGLALFLLFNWMSNQIYQQARPFEPAGGKGNYFQTVDLVGSEMPDGTMEWVAWEVQEGQDLLFPEYELGFQLSDSVYQSWLRRYDLLLFTAGNLPDEDYLILLATKNQDLQLIGWLKEKEGTSWQALPVDTLEKMTGLDFFATYLPPEIQDSLESMVDTFRWTLPPQYIGLPKQ